MEPLFQITIPFRVAIKKNNTQRKYSFKKKKTFTCPSDRYLQWEAEAVQFLKRVKLVKYDEFKKINEPLRAEFKFYFKNHQHEPDLSNCYEGPQDALQKAGIIEDDKLIYSHDGSRKIFGSEERIGVKLYPLSEGDKILCLGCLGKN